MSLLDEVKAWPMPEPVAYIHADGEVRFNGLSGMGRVMTVVERDAIRTARESVAAEADARMARLCEALESVVDWLDAPDESAFSDAQLERLRAALSEARKP